MELGGSGGVRGMGLLLLLGQAGWGTMGWGAGGVVMGRVGWGWVGLGVGWGGV